METAGTAAASLVKLGAIGADNREGRMTVRRIVPNLRWSDPLQAQRFYADLLGLEV